MKNEDFSDAPGPCLGKTQESRRKDHTGDTDHITDDETQPAPARYAQIHLPPLYPEEALRLVALLERASRAIWRAHGMQMGECLVDRHMNHVTTSIDPNDFDLPF